MSDFGTRNSPASISGLLLLPESSFASCSPLVAFLSLLALLLSSSNADAGSSIIRHADSPVFRHHLDTIGFAGARVNRHRIAFCKSAAPTSNRRRCGMVLCSLAIGWQDQQEQEQQHHHQRQHLHACRFPCRLTRKGGQRRPWNHAYRPMK